jgi:hypothetical protein
MHQEGTTPEEPKAPATPSATISPELKYVIAGYLLVGAGIIAAVLLAKKNDITIGVSEGFAPFAVIYIVAQAIERFIQPFTGFAVKAEDKTKTRNELAASVTALQSGASAMGVTAEATTAVAKQRDLEQIQADRAMAFWALATFLALVICGALELGLIQSIAKVTGAEGGEPPQGFLYLDVVLTGIAVGSGTKPLHDLIGFIQNKKEAAAPTPPAAAG